MKRIVIILILLLGGLAARADNIVSVSSASGHPQDEVTLNVSLANTDAAVAFQAEIPLGSQLTYVANSIALNPARITDHQVSAAVVGGNLRIYAFSLSLTPFVGNSGNLLSFTLKLKNEPGDYPITLNNALLSNTSGTSLPLTPSDPSNPFTGQVTLLSPKLQINTTTINYGHVPIRSEYTQNASVTNVGNEPLTITSITFSNAVFSCPGFTQTTLQPGNSTNFAFKFAPMVKGALTATATVASNSISGNGIIHLVADPFAVNELHFGGLEGYCDSIVEIPVTMNNMEDITGFQIDMNLPEQLEYVDFNLSDRKTDHVAIGVFNEGLLRLMGYSASGSAFTGDDGVIGTLSLRLHGLSGYYSLNPVKAVLADVNGEDVLSDQYSGYVSIRSPQIVGNESLGFGESPVTETVTREYIVSNNGNAQMRIDQVVFDQSDFSVAETFPIMIGSWGNTTLHVSYNREQKGNFSALMKIYSNDPQNGLKNVALSGHRYEPNSIELTADAFSLEDGDVAVSLAMDNYSGIVALQANFRYPYEDYSVQASDFQLTERFAGHTLYALPINDSTFRILVLSMQNSAVSGHEGAVLNVTLHPIGTPSEEEHTVSVTDVVLSDAESGNVFTGEEASATFVLIVTQATQLDEGWTWWGTSIEQSDNNCLTMLEESLNPNGKVIKSSSKSVQYQAQLHRWIGGLTSLTNEEGYRIQTTEACNSAIAGRPAVPENHPITLNPNWTWIGYPVSYSQTVGEALSGFSPMVNDIIKSQSSNARYLPSGWVPATFTLHPGESYLYYSKATTDKTLVYANSRSHAVSVEKEDKYWHYNIHDFADNLVLLAVVNVDDEEQHTDDLELGAFVNGECRGSARLIYVEPYNRYYAMMNVMGEDGDLVEFVAVNHQTGTVSGTSFDRFVFETNAIVGEFDSPFMVSFRTDSSLNEYMGRLDMYPNPVNRDEAIRLLVPQQETIVEMSITNVLGSVVRHKKGGFSADAIDGIPESGIYLVRVACQSGNVYLNKLVVK